MYLCSHNNQDFGKMTLKLRARNILIVIGLSFIGLLIYYLAWEVFEEVLSFLTGAEIHNETSFGWNFSLWEFLTDFLAAFVVTTIYATAYWYFVHRVKRERDKYRLLAYESQLRPHFVFNNFSLLTDLIEVDPKKATEFIMILNKYYRYTLSHTEHDLVNLQDELEFTNNFISLIKERFGENVQVNIAPQVSALQGSVPPVVMQMLIENAIKHNEHTQSHPLVIEVTGDDQYIHVSNKKRPVSTTDSTHIGQHNIIGRYRLLSRKNVIIRETDEEYCVSIPLIHQKL